jgi:hypothetical protein
VFDQNCVFLTSNIHTPEGRQPVKTDSSAKHIKKREGGIANRLNAGQPGVPIPLEVNNFTLFQNV